MGKPRHLMTADERAKADAYQKAYRERNADRLREYKNRPDVKAMHKAYRQRPDVKVKLKSSKDAWVQQNRERVRECERTRYQRNLDAGRAKCREWRTKNPDKASIAARKWAKANPDLAREYKRNSDAKRRSADGRHTAADIAALHRLQKGKCAACRSPLDAFHVDHIVAIARGGTNDRINLQLLCPTCNLQKGAKHPVDFMQSKGFLL